MSFANLMLSPFRMAHEVYVLTTPQISAAKHANKVNPWDALQTHHNLVLFAVWALGIGGSLAVALYLKSLSIFQKIGQSIDRATYFAPDVIRVSLGAALVAGAHFHGVFGPELPVSSFSIGWLLEPFMYVVGIAMIVGIANRVTGILVSLFWLYTLIDHGWYMLTYLNYLGEALALALIPWQNFSLDRFFIKYRRNLHYEEWAMPIARILFGAALLYAAINVKFVTAQLSVDVVNQYHLTRYFPFDPLFVVLGAGLVECLMAGLFIVGLLNRVNSLMFIGFITASLLFFKEAVWPHYLLLGLAAGIFLHRPDKLALDSRLFRRKRN